MDLRRRCLACSSATPVDHVVQVGQHLLGGQVQVGERLYGGAQPPHGGRGVHAVADHIADHQRDPGAGQRDDVEPVAADPAERVGRQIAVGGLHRALLGQIVRQQAALEGEGRGVLAGVPAGVVDGDRGAGRRIPRRAPGRRAGTVRRAAGGRTRPLPGRRPAPGAAPPSASESPVPADAPPGTGRRPTGHRRQDPASGAAWSRPRSGSARRAPTGDRRPPPRCATTASGQPSRTDCAGRPGAW